MNNETLIETDNVRVRILELAPDGATPWHYHTEIDDNMFCLEGEIAIQLADPTERIVLHPGQRCEVRTGRVHRVVNLRSDKARYLLVQGTGRYDFNTVEH